MFDLQSMFKVSIGQSFNFGVLIALDEKSMDHRSQCDSSSGHNECL